MIVGIDPGISGAVAWVSDEGGVPVIGHGYADPGGER